MTFLSVGQLSKRTNRRFLQPYQNAGLQSRLRLHFFQSGIDLGKTTACWWRKRTSEVVCTKNNATATCRIRCRLYPTDIKRAAAILMLLAIAALSLVVENAALLRRLSVGKVGKDDKDDSGHNDDSCVNVIGVGAGVALLFQLY